MQRLLEMTIQGEFYYYCVSISRILLYFSPNCSSKLFAFMWLFLHSSSDNLQNELDISLFNLSVLNILITNYFFIDYIHPKCCIMIKVVYMLEYSFSFPLCLRSSSL